MEKCERETVIVHNLADIDDGFVRVYTTEEKVMKRLVRRLGDEAETTTIYRSGSKDASGWRIKVPIELVSRTTFGFKKAKVRRGKL
jgi:hypothetical protein